MTNEQQATHVVVRTAQHGWWTDDCECVDGSPVGRQLPCYCHAKQRQKHALAQARRPSCPRCEVDDGARKMWTTCAEPSKTHLDYLQGVEGRTGQTLIWAL